MSHPGSRILRFFIIFGLLFGLYPSGGGLAAETPPGAPASPATTTAGVKIYLPAVFDGRAAVPAPAPGFSGNSSEALIEADLAAGLIDYGTALRYKAYAWFEDPRLPEKYLGSGPTEDLSLFEELRNPLQPVDAALQAELDSFLARPDDPASLFNTQAAGAQRLPQAAAVCGANGWASAPLSDPALNVTVHVKCTGNYETDLAYVVGVLAAHVPEMNALMGAPLPDLGGAKGGGSDDIDVYLLDPLGSANRTYLDTIDHINRHGGAVRDDPKTNLRSSGYVLLKRNLLSDPFMVDVIVHEYFHVLQFAHNSEIHFKDHKEWWFGEATATWAETYFLQSTARDHVHFPLFLAGFRVNKLPLGLAASITGDQQAMLYQQYLWPLFMEMEKGPQAIAQAWKNLAGVTDWFLGMDKISQVLPFETNFRRFSQRNLNTRLGTGEGIITPRYKDLHPAAQFPDFVEPIPEAEEDDVLPVTRQAGPKTYATTIPSLRAVYYHYTFNRDANKIVLDLSPLSQYGNIQVDAVVRTWQGDWEIRPLGLTNHELCEISEMWLIINNTEMDYTKSTEAKFGLMPLTESCSCVAVAQALENVDHFEMEMSVHYAQSAARNQESVSTKNDVSVTAVMTESHFTAGSAAYVAPNFGGVASVDYIHTIQNSSTTVVGSGVPIPYDIPKNNYSRAFIHFNLDKCTYNFTASIYVDAISTSSNGSSSQVKYDVADIGSAARPVDESLTVSGSQAFPAHSPEYILDQPDIFDFYGQNVWEITSWLGEANQGNAMVSWSFKPVFLP